MHKREPDLLTARAVCQTLGISHSTFYGDPRHGCPPLRDRLLAKGLQVVHMPPARLGQKPRLKYTRASLNRPVENAAKREAMLC